MRQPLTLASNNMADFSLTAVFGMDASGMKTELKTLRKEVASFATDWAKIGAGAAVAAFAMLSKGAMELAGSLTDASANIGINVESLQALQQQHARNGVSNEELVVALQKTKAAVIGAAEGDAKAEAALKKLGLASADLIKLPLAEQYAAIAKGAAGAANSNAAFSAVADLLGAKVGPKLMGSLKELGEIGLPGVTKSAKEAGHVMSDTTIAALDAAGDAIDDFKKKATIWAGEIIVNFRTAEGLELIQLQIMRLLSMAAGRVLDGISEAGSMISAVVGASFTAIIYKFHNGLVSAVQDFVGMVNQVLPKGLRVNAEDLDAFKVTGFSVSGEIVKAIAKTQPSELMKKFGEAWDGPIAAQKQIVEDLNKVDFKKAADEVTTAGAKAGKSVEDGGKKAGDSIEAGLSVGEAALQRIFDDMLNGMDDVVEKFSVAIDRAGANYKDQSTTALKGVRDRISSQLQDAQRADRESGGGVGSTGESFATSAFKSELYNIEKELAARQQFNFDFARLGSTQTLAKYGDADYQRYTKEMQDQSTRTTNAIEQIARGLTGAGIIQPNR
jgi:hypothetical protein